MLQEVFDLFRSREPIPFVILAFLAIGWMVILERVVILQLVYRVNFKKFNQTLRKMLAAGDLDRARAYCIATSKTGLPLIALKAIETYESDNFRVRAVVSEEALDFMPRIRRRIAQLPALATVAVLLGALAAVNGVWQAFQMADVLEMGLKNFAFTRGLSNALTPLSLSIVSSILLMFPYGLLDSMAARLEGEIEHSLTIILNLLAPELQPVFGQPMAPVTSSVGAISVDSAPMQSAHEAAPVANKGPYEEVSSGERAEPVPDEEEII